MFGTVRRGMALLSIVMLGAVAGSLPATASVSPWRVTPTPNPGGNQVATIYFLGVAAAGPKDAWGVGIDDVRFRRPLVEHWDGRSWAPVRVPQPVGRQAWFRGRSG